MDSKNRKASNIVPLPKPNSTATKLASERKWGVEVIGLGFCILPSLLFRAQERLGLSATQLAVIVHIADFWWSEDKVPWSTKALLGQRLGLGTKQIQRIVRQLEEAGYLKRIKRVNQRGQRANGFDLSGLVAKLKKLAPEFEEVAEARRKVERRGGLKKKA